MSRAEARRIPSGWARSRQLSDVGVVLLAVAAAIGAWRSWPLPLGPAVVVAAVALLIRRPVLLIIGVGLLASALGARSWAGDRPMAAGPFAARGTLVTDPQRTAGAVHAEVRAHGHHVDVWARGRAGATLAQRAAGESIDISGAATPRPPGDDWAARRHLVGRVDVDRLTMVGRGDLITRAANTVRRSLLRGATVMAPGRRALFAGFVLGDARDQSAVIAQDFRGAGLSHLLVVSGENVAFVIAVVAPALRRLGPRSRWLFTVVLLAFFALITRFEPSVLRATFMAALAVTAWSLGRPSSGVRLLGLAVTAVLLIDPLLVGVFGFQLSVAASAGIVVLARPLAQHLPLPRLVALPLAVTLAAQVAVAPLVMTRAGGLPVASVPANLLAEPAAALIMAWGMTAGLLAGWLPSGLAGVVHAPTDLLLRWVELVARQGSALPLGEVRASQLAGLVVLASLAVGAAKRGRRGFAIAGWLVVVALAVLPAVMLADARPPRADLAGVGTVWRSSADGRSITVVVLASGVGDRSVLEGLHRAGVDRIDLLVSPSGSATAGALVATLRQRVTVDEVWVPRRRDARGARAPVIVPASDVPELGDHVTVGTIQITVMAVDGRLDVEVVGAPEGALDGGVGSGGAPRARSPPLRRQPSSGRHGHPEPHPGLLLRQGLVLRLRRVPEPGREAGRRRG